MKKISLLLPVFNHLQYTRKCVQTLDRLVLKGHFSHCTFHIIVVDDGSTDGTPDFLTQHYPEIHLLRGDGNLWWSGGINMGALYAIRELGSDYVLLWNNDITPATDYFLQLDKLVHQTDERTLLGSKIFYQGDRRVIWSFGGIFNPSNGKKYMVGMDHPDSEEYHKALHVDWLPGMGTLVPVQVIDAIGLWDEKVFPQYHGDSDFTFRARKAGYEVVVRPELLLWNDKSSSGLTHGDTLKGLIKALTSIRSNLNIKKNYLFYRRFATSWRAYLFLVRYYFRITGGFLKWKILALFGRKRD